MAAQTSEQRRRGQLRKRLFRGLLIGGAAVGLPAVANTLIRRRVGRVPAPRWGRSHRYSCRRGRMFFQRLGAGPPVVLVHSLGVGHSGEEWQEVAERLASDHQVFVPDLPGWGRSPIPRGEVSPEFYVEVLRDFLRDVVREPAVLIGVGSSAAYAAEVAARAAQETAREGGEAGENGEEAGGGRVRALGLVAPLGLEAHSRGTDLQDRLLHWLLQLPVLGTAALHFVTRRPQLVRSLRNEVYSAPERVDAALLERHYRASHHEGAHTSLGAYLAGKLHHDVEVVLPVLDLPIWLAWGRKSVHPPVEDADLWLLRLGSAIPGHLPGAELEVFEESRGLPHAEQPAAFARALRAFLAGLD